MVLDLRLVKIGCRETINFFCTYTKKQGAGDVSPQVYRRNRIIRQLKFLKTSLQATQPPYFEIATLHHVLPRHAGRVWLACRRTVPYWLLANPAPRANVPRCRRGRISVQMRLHLVPDAVASGPACADNHYPSFFPPLPTFQHSNEAPISKTEGRYNKKGTCHFVVMTRPQLFIQLFNQNSYYISYISCKPYPSSEVFSSSDSEVDTSGRCPLLDSDRCYI